MSELPGFAPSVPADSPDFDVILVGAGLGSLWAACLLANIGMRCLLLEKSAYVGGGGAYSGGLVWAPGNHRMRAKAIPDSQAEALLYLSAISQDDFSPELAATYIDAAPSVLLDIERMAGMRWVTYPSLPDYYDNYPGAKPNGRFLVPHPDAVAPLLQDAVRRFPEMDRVRRTPHLGEDPEAWIAGRALAGCLWYRCLRSGVEYSLGSRVTSLLVDSGRVNGVTWTVGGHAHTTRAKGGVMLNTGGFEWNDALCSTYFAGRPPAHPQTPPSNEGDGHLMAAAIGARLTSMHSTIGTPGVRVSQTGNDGRPLYRLIFQELAQAHSVVVNSAGVRFANETFFPDIVSAWEKSHSSRVGGFPNLPSYLIFDAAYSHSPSTMRARFGEAVMGPFATLEALARATGIDAHGLDAEVIRYNALVKASLADTLGRGSSLYQRVFATPGDHFNPTMGTVHTAPFHCLELQPSTSGHIGGLSIDIDARVLDSAGAPIRGLYASGNCAAAAQIVGGNYFSGIAVGHALVFGAQAVRSIMRSQGCGG